MVDKKDASDHAQLGQLYVKDAGEAGTKALIIGSLLILFHLLEIKASSFDAVGIRIELPDPIILYGALSVIFLNHFYVYFFNSVYADALVDWAPKGPLIRRQLKVFRRRKGATPARVKEDARSTIIFVRVMMVPYYAVVFAIIVVATVVAVWDTYRFAGYLWERYWP